jgi:hypothetical protein
MMVCHYGEGHVGLTVSSVRKKEIVCLLKKQTNKQLNRLKFYHII